MARDIMLEMAREHPEIAKLFADFEAGNRAAMAKAAKADPARFAGTKVFDTSAHYRYFRAGIVVVAKTRLDVIDFCYSVNRNAAGNFLIWRETSRYRRGRWFQSERDQWGWTPQKKEALALCRRRATKARADNPEMLRRMPKGK
jgi:hypothetical protein